MNQQRQQVTRAQENQQISADSQRNVKLNQLLADVRAKRGDIEAILPPDIKFEKFTACLNMAIRREPKLLECYPPTLIRAVLMSAYDGLMPDGREAVIVYRSEKYREGNGPERRRLEASYMPMAYGLRKKIVQVGAAKHIEATVVHKNDVFFYQKGLDPKLEHIPVIDKEPGEAIAVYSVAILPDGERVFEVMSKGQVMAVKEKAQTKMVWDGPFGDEMWRKSVIRRHSKALPSAERIRDAEADVEFPDYGSGAALDGSKRIAAPTRDQFRGQLGAPAEDRLDLGQWASGGDFEQGEEDGREGNDAAGVRGSDAADAGPDRSRANADRRAKPKSDPADAGRAEQEAAEGAREGDAVASAAEALPRPSDAAGWDAWKKQVLAEVAAAQDEPELNRIQEREAANIQAAPQKIGSAIEDSITDCRIVIQEGH